MKKSLIIVIGIFYYCSSSAQNKDVETLKKLNAGWIGAYVTKDTAAMSRIFFRRPGANKPRRQGHQ
jgi:hypothetical protein